jgi:hypothetical protein
MRRQVCAEPREQGRCYVVIAHGNPTLVALRKAGLITEHGYDGRVVTIKAKD